ncbi:MAG: hypothetical protein CME10_03375 [Gemmatimonadetes bacterium]|jgi:microcompartment protein CcmK/EutM|nr:hypothetical protein [Gemmatimonadota bacterium]
MKLGEVIGTVVLSRSIDSYKGQILHLVLDLDEDMAYVGNAEVCATWEARQEGEHVVVEVAREAANFSSPAIPVDATIIGKVDSVHIDAASKTD